MRISLPFNTRQRCLMVGIRPQRITGQPPAYRRVYQQFIGIRIVDVRNLLFGINQIRREQHTDEGFSEVVLKLPVAPQCGRTIRRQRKQRIQYNPIRQPSPQRTKAKANQIGNGFLFLHGNSFHELCNSNRIQRKRFSLGEKLEFVSPTILHAIGTGF